MIMWAAVSSALAVFVAVYTLVTPGRALTARLDRFQRVPNFDRDALLSEPFVVRVGGPLVDRFQRLARRLLPGSILTSVERRLVLAGEPLSLHAFLSVQIVMAGAGIVLGLFVITSNPSATTALVAAPGAALLAGVPLYWLRLKVASRKKAILRALPDAVDLIVTSVEAGLAIDAALAQVGQDTRGPLGEELRLTVRETALGRSRRDALQYLIERTQVPELKTFVQSLIQAELTGIPIGQVLRTQAAQMRVRRRQRAEAQAQRAPVKMVLVLVLFVLPSMLLMVIGPAVMHITASL